LLESVTYGVYSYATMVPPVLLAMVLSSLATIYINTTEYSQSASEGLAGAYQVYSTSDDGSSGSGELLAKGALNALVIVCAIGLMTFVMVGCFYFNCNKFLMGYLLLSCFVLYGVMGGQLWAVAIDKYKLNVDVFTYYFICVNFAVLGIVSLFLNDPDVTPPSFSQIYAIFAAVLLSWNLSHFEAWTGWALLVMLGLYDLCAVLTPCGPLKALVNLMQAKESRGENGTLPGLLYEAQVPVSRGGGGRSRRRREEGGEEQKQDGDGEQQERPPLPVRDRDGEQQERPPLPVPFGLALVLKLPIIDATEVPEKADGAEYTLLDRLKIVHCRRPPRYKFAKKEKNSSSDGKARYFVLEEDTGTTTTYVIDEEEEGRVFVEEIEEEGDSEDEEQGRIKLGLGDFIFYSVLVSKAAMYSFTTAIVCIVIILAGLGGTLALLSVYKQALPALPFSIFFGVIFYLITRYITEPWFKQILTIPLYL